MFANNTSEYVELYQDWLEAQRGYSDKPKTNTIVHRFMNITFVGPHKKQYLSCSVVSDHHMEWLM